MVSTSLISQHPLTNFNSFNQRTSYIPTLQFQIQTTNTATKILRLNLHTYHKQTTCV